MAEWLTVDEGGTQPAAKLRAVGATTAESDEDKLAQLLLVIQTKQEVRQTQAAVWHSYITPLNIVAPAIAVQKAHADQTRGQSGHKLGPPHVQSFRAFMATLVSLLEKAKSELTEVQESHTILAKELENYQSAGVQSAWLIISQIRYKETKEGKGVVNFALSDMLEPGRRHRLEIALYHALVALGSEVRPGAAPASDSERKVQKQIDVLKAKLKK